MEDCTLPDELLDTHVGGFSSWKKWEQSCFSGHRLGSFLDLEETRGNKGSVSPAITEQRES